MPSPRASRVRRGRVARSTLAVMSVTVGIVGTVALPSYAVHPSELHAGGLRPGNGTSVVQSFVVSSGAEPSDAIRHDFGATTMEELEARRAKKLAEERAFLEAKKRALEAAVAGRLTEEVVAGTHQASAGSPTQIPANAPPAPNGSIVSVARQYLGVPYVFGGASPAGFDCSGLVKHVYAKFGISLPHSSMAQGANGTRVADPQPGDLVVIDGGSHIGIYSGDGYMVHAPMPGRTVTERPIYTANHYFVRY
jgi:cell wall-associated NlpC family hydrolase